MRINNQPPLNTDNAADKSTRTDSAHTPPPAPNSASSPSSLAYSLVPSFELFSLDAALSQIPPVRQDVVSQIVQRLASGDLQSLKALEQTADAIVGK